MSDPTYDRKEIDRNPDWQLAFVISELVNDSSPIGWSKYVLLAHLLLLKYKLVPKATLN